LDPRYGNAWMSLWHHMDPRYGTTWIRDVTPRFCHYYQLFGQTGQCCWNIFSSIMLLEHFHLNAVVSLCADFFS